MKKKIKKRRWSIFWKEVNKVVRVYKERNSKGKEKNAEKINLIGNNASEKI
jgi:hypothetical protein